MLELSYPLMDHVELHVPGPGGEVLSFRTGYATPFDTRAFAHRNFVFPLGFSGREEKTIYARFENSDRMEIPLTVWTEKGFHSNERIEQYVLGMYYGLLAVMIVYNLFLFATVRDRSFLHYVLYLVSFSAWQLTQNGYAYEYLPGPLRGSNHYIPLTISLLIASAGLFSRSYLDTPARAPVMDRIIKAQMALAGCMVLAPLAFDYATSIIMNLIIAMAGIATIFVTGGIMIARRYRPAIFLMLAWTCFLLGGLVYTLKVFGALPGNFFTTYAIQAGSAIEVILLSLGLGDRINILKKEKEEETRKLLQISQELDFARKIQQSTLPNSLPVQESLTIAATCIPMEKVGGDFFDFHDMGDGKMGVLISDVSGHGVPSALIASMVKITFDVLKKTAGDPADVLSGMNRILYGNIENQFLTALYAVIDREAGQVVHSRAGHPPLMIVRKGGEAPESPKPRGKPIGLLPETDFELSSVPVRPGDRIILYTDCIIEAKNSRNDMLGEDAFRKAVMANAGATPGGLIASIVELLRRWTGMEQSFDDDFTMVVVDIK